MGSDIFQNTYKTFRRLVLDILTDALAAMPIVESSIHAKTPDKKESSTESDGDVMELVVPTTTGPDVASAASLLLITLTRSQLLSEAMINEVLPPLNDHIIFLFLLLLQIIFEAEL